MVTGNSSGDVHYLQSQNGNLFTGRYFDGSGDEDPSEFEPLREHIPSEIPWCSDALGARFDACSSDRDLTLAVGKSPDAVNLWIGDGQSVTSIHSGAPSHARLLFLAILIPFRLW